MKAERIYKKQAPRTLVQKSQRHKAMNMSVKQPCSPVVQLRTSVSCGTKFFKYADNESEEVGNKMEAYLDPADPQRGSAPGNVLCNTMKALEEAGYSSMIRGHLLNDNLGGPGIACNLFPITAKANHLHLLNAENHIKQYLSNIYNVGVMYSVEVTEANYTIDDPSCCFTCEAYPWNVATGYVDKSNPVLYPIDIKSVPIKNDDGKGEVVPLPTGTNTFGEQYDYSNNYRATSISFSNSQLPFGWGSIGAGKGRNRNWSHIYHN